jgi:hypothetical protein
MLRGKLPKVWDTGQSMSQLKQCPTRPCSANRILVVVVVVVVLLLFAMLLVVYLHVHVVVLGVGGTIICAMRWASNLTFASRPKDHYYCYHAVQVQHRKQTGTES